MKFLLSKHITNIFFRATKQVLVLAVIIATISSNNSFANPKDEKTTHQLQAELIYNFIDHVVWLSDVPTVKNLCVINDNPVIPYLKFLAKDNRKIIITRKYENDYLDDCNILFVNEFYQGYSKRLLMRVRSKPILTFGNLKDFAKNGGIVQFTLRNDRVEFLFNIKEMESSGFEINKNIVSISSVID